MSDTQRAAQREQSGADAHRAGAARGNRKVVIACLSALTVMGAATAASPTLYRLFCQVTGYGGTTQRAVAPSDTVLDRTITVRFDGNVSPKLPWKFEPVQPTMTVKVGETALAFFRATNTSDRPTKGTASFNVTPELMGVYFSKIECFCFTEQTLQPGQSVEMPVTFYVDPKMIADRDTASITLLTLSYVFFPTDKTAEAPAHAVSGPRAAQGGG